MRKKIIHIIFDLGRGGAETMLVAVVKELPEYENIIITLFSSNHFKNELECDELYDLDLKLRDLLFFPRVVMRLRRIFNKIKPDLIHTHLYWPTVLTRMAAPKSIPVVTTIHSFVSQMADYKKWYLKLFDRLTYKLRPTVIIAVSKGALDEYFSFLKLKRHRSYCLYNFVDTKRFKQKENSDNSNGKVRIVTVGALRYSKNYMYLLESLQFVKQENTFLDIYGGGPLENEIRDFIIQNKLSSVTLKGQMEKVESLLMQYDIFVMASKYEGLSLSVLEAMATGIPLLLSDIPSFREQCEDTAVYFKLNDPQDFSQKLKWMQNNKEQVQKNVSRALFRVNEQFTLDHHISDLRMIYKEVLELDNQDS